MPHLSRYIFWFMPIVLCSCATIEPNTPIYYYDEIVVRNLLSNKLENVEIRVANSHGIFICSYIPAKAECSNKFRKRKYTGNPVSVRWIFQQQNRAAEEFVLQVPTHFDTQTNMRGILEINEYGQVRAYLHQ